MSARHKTDAAPAIKASLQRISVGSFILQSAIADEFALHPRDLQAISFLSLFGDLSAGDLCRHLNLTTGATSTLIDRLERRGFVERMSDPQDRRRVLVRLHGPAVAKLRLRYAAIERRVAKALAGLSRSERSTIATFLERLTPATTEMHPATRPGRSHR